MELKECLEMLQALGLGSTENQIKLFNLVQRSQSKPTEAGKQVLNSVYGETASTTAQGVYRDTDNPTGQKTGSPPEDTMANLGEYLKQLTATMKAQSQATKAMLTLMQAENARKGVVGEDTRSLEERAQQDIYTILNPGQNTPIM